MRHSVLFCVSDPFLSFTPSGLYLPRPHISRFAIDSVKRIPQKSLIPGKTGTLANLKDIAFSKLQKCNAHGILSFDWNDHFIFGGNNMARKTSPRERIAELLDQKDMRQKELAKRTGVSESQLSRIISGETSTINSDTLIALSKEFNVSTDYLLCLTDMSARKNSDISELGLSEAAVRKLLDGSINTDILNRLMEHKDFPYLLKLIQIYFCDSVALGIADRNESINLIIEVLTDFSTENPEYKEEVRQDQDVLKAQKMKPHEAENEKIKEVLFRILRDIKQGIENKVPTSPIMMAGTMKEMLAVLPRDKRRVAKHDIVNYVARQMEKQCKDLDREALELVHDISERMLAMSNRQ
ncbi:MAG: helix-turn-helix transcriptional regulator [Clostridia bacterium]|nr:helix-turn-helix transcriptional regulator [Clostridia bacterium]